MQTYKDRAKRHQRSISLIDYEEIARHDSLVPEVEFSQRRPLSSETEFSDNGSAPIDSIASQEKCPLTAGYEGKVVQPLNPAVLTSNASTMTVFGHRRALSLRERLNVGYDYIVVEFEHAREVAGKTVASASETVWKVCHFSNLPNWMQDNEYLHWGYRPPLPSFWACIKSIFRIHTETGNIWTHGIGVLIFLALFIYTFLTMSANKNSTDKLMLIIYFSGIITCLFFSTLFHTFNCYASPKIAKIFTQLDYCGISLQILGSMIPALYYGFYNHFTMYKIYISFGVLLCISSIVVSMWNKFGEPKYRSLRATVFLTFGLSNVIPSVHWAIILDSRLLTAYSMFVIQGALYVLGSVLYANRIPERFFPGRCDYIFQSHQIFHVLVVLAALVHLTGINSMADFVAQQNSTELNVNVTTEVSPITSR